MIRVQCRQQDHRVELDEVKNLCHEMDIRWLGLTSRWRLQGAMVAVVLLQLLMVLVEVGRCLRGWRASFVFVV